MVAGQLPPARNVLLVAAGGAIGTVARVALTAKFPGAGSFPWATFVANVLGAFVLGVVITLLAERIAGDPSVRLFLCTGALGAFTTYSALARELDQLATGRHLALAGLYATASLTVGLIGVLAGVRLARARPAPGPPRLSRRGGGA